MASSSKDKGSLRLRPDLLKSFAAKILKDHGEIAKATEVETMASHAEIGEQLQALLGSERWRQCIAMTQSHSLSGLFIAGGGRLNLPAPHSTLQRPPYSQKTAGHADWQELQTTEVSMPAQRAAAVMTLRPEEAAALHRASAQLTQLSFGARRVAEVSPSCAVLLAGSVRHCVVVALKGAALPACASYSSQGSDRPELKITADHVVIHSLK
mmetsp:Transcript_52418/g.97039  ORF Transcript_52418/g.97039 Transcript_52418/m.97039 type:complete len:211 (+) Transcript_52418:67-699(+)